jgi:hypothetical protein
VCAEIEEFTISSTKNLYIGNFSRGFRRSTTTTTTTTTHGFLITSIRNSVIVHKFLLVTCGGIKNKFELSLESHTSEHYSS